MILYLILRFFRGRLHARGADADVLRLANLCSEYNVPVRAVTKTADGAALTVSGAYARRVREICARFGVAVTMKTDGFPRLWELYRRRIGLFVGAALAVAAVLVSDLFVWSIDVVGNVTVPDEEILSVLEKSGLRVGARKSSLELHRIALDAELAINRVAWLSVNLQGTRALVEMRETVTAPEGVDMTTATDLVAARDGQIVYTEARSGAVMVKRRDVVMKGDLLISGIVDSKAFGFKTVRSVGRVLAQTERVFTATAPLVKEEKRFTGARRVRTSVSVFGKTFTFGKPAPFDHADRVFEKNDVTLFSTVTLPVTLVRETFLEYVPTTVPTTEEEAAAEARREIAETLREELSGAEILSRSEEVAVSEGGVTVTLRVRCIEDICTERLIRR